MSPAPVLRARVARDGAVEVSLSGRCMEPLLRAGDAALVVPAGRLRAGDIVLVELPGGVLALHRAVRLLPGGRLVSKGDFSGRAEELCVAAVVGRAAALRLAGSDGWAPYRQGPLSGRALCLLSRLLIAKRPDSFGYATRRLARKAIWRMGERARRRMLDESGNAESAVDSPALAALSRAAGIEEAGAAREAAAALDAGAGIEG